MASGTLASRPAMQRTCRDILHIHIPRATSFTLPQNNRNDFRVLHAVLRIGSILAQLILVGVPAGTYRCSSLSLGPFGRLHATSSTCRIVVRLSIRRRSPIGARVAQHTSMIVALASLLRFKTKNSRLLAHLRGGDEEVRSRCSAPSRRVRVRRPAQGHDGASAPTFLSATRDDRFCVVASPLITVASNLHGDDLALLRSLHVGGRNRS